MIDNKQLMLGNAVYFRNSSDVTDSNDVVFITGILSSGITANRNCDAESNLDDGLYVEFIEPIQMEEKWILALGFDKTNCKDHPTEFLCKYFVGQISDEEWNLEFIDENNRPTVIKTFRYVHELQNLLKILL